MQICLPGRDIVIFDTKNLLNKN